MTVIGNSAEGGDLGHYSGHKVRLLCGRNDTACDDLPTRRVIWRCECTETEEYLCEHHGRARPGTSSSDCGTCGYQVVARSNVAVTTRELRKVFGNQALDGCWLCHDLLPVHGALELDTRMGRRVRVCAEGCKVDAHRASAAQVARDYQGWQSVWVRKSGRGPFRLVVGVEHDGREVVFALAGGLFLSVDVNKRLEYV